MLLLQQRCPGGRPRPAASPRAAAAPSPRRPSAAAAVRRGRPAVQAAAAAGDGEPSAPPAAAATAEQQQQQQPPPTGSAAGSAASSRDGEAGTASRRAVRKADSTDAVASFLSRRFGLAGGLAWLGVLAVGTLGEQVKTRWEVASEAANTRDVADAQRTRLASGVEFVDRRIGGGQAPRKGFLVVVDYVARADGVEFENTKARGKPIVFVFGSRPFTGGMCAGVEEAMSTMRAGGKRSISVPPEAGFGERGTVLRPTEHVPDKQGVVPGNATLEYELELVRVSIPPS